MPGQSLDRLHEHQCLWEGVRRYYAPFESEIRPGPPMSIARNARRPIYEPARTRARLGIELAERGHARYAMRNRIFRRHRQATPTSKVVGAWRSMMVANDCAAPTYAEIRPRRGRVSGVHCLRAVQVGKLGIPGQMVFPPQLSRKVLRVSLPPCRPGDALAAVVDLGGGVREDGGL